MSHNLENLPLYQELLSGEIKKVLLCHIHDRWYTGELFCHATWIPSLQKAGINCSICTHSGYLELFANQPGIVGRYAADELNSQLLADHDLVIFAATHPPKAYDERVHWAIYSWNDGIAFVRDGHLEWSQPTTDFNLFSANCHKQGQTALPNGEYFRMQMTIEERTAASHRLEALLDTRNRPVTIFNPSASNSHTRESQRAKAVNNKLNLTTLTHLLEHLLAAFPDHHIVVGASLKPGDQRNYEDMVELATRFASDGRVVSLMDGVDPCKGLSFRAFAAILVDCRVFHMIGNSTGSNAHLAAALNVPAVSIERAADEAMKANWRIPGRGQMGSFRWRNPHPCTAAYNLAWDKCTQADELLRIVRLLQWHSAAFWTGWMTWFGPKLNIACVLARLIVAGVFDDGPDVLSLAQWSENVSHFAMLLAEDELRSIYFSFIDEAEYFYAINELGPAAVMDYLTALGQCRKVAEVCTLNDLYLTKRERVLVAQMSESSNLFKVLCALAALPRFVPLAETRQNKGAKQQ